MLSSVVVVEAAIVVALCERILFWSEDGDVRPSTANCAVRAHPSKDYLTTEVLRL
jgi:hypothetical protein